MEVECPYCSVRVDIASLENHVRMMDGEGHGPGGEVPFDGVDNPWNLRIDTSNAPDPDEHGGGTVPSVRRVVDDVRQGWCPACDRGVLGFKGGDGFLSSGRRRLACPNCGWESPEWLEIRE